MSICIFHSISYTTQMILKAQHHTIVYPFFRWFSCWYTQRHFHQVIIKGDYDNQGKGVLLVANHISWWDGFWAVYLNETVFRAWV